MGRSDRKGRDSSFGDDLNRRGSRCFHIVGAVSHQCHYRRGGLERFDGALLGQQAINDFHIPLEGDVADRRSDSGIKLGGDSSGENTGGCSIRREHDTRLQSLDRLGRRGRKGLDRRCFRHVNPGHRRHAASCHRVGQGAGTRDDGLHIGASALGYREQRAHRHLVGNDNYHVVAHERILSCVQCD